VWRVLHFRHAAQERYEKYSLVHEHAHGRERASDSLLPLRDTG